MSIVDVIRTALFSLGSNRLRATLALLGIVLGIASVITLMAIGRGATLEIRQTIESFGSNLLFISSTGSGGITMRDVEALRVKSDAPSVNLVAPEIDHFGTLIYRQESVGARISGVSAEFQDVRNIELASGIFITPAHTDARSDVVVLGSELSASLFGSRDPVSAYIRVDGKRFRVIGVLKSQDVMFESTNHQAFVPITTAFYRLTSRFTISGEIRVDTIYAQAMNDRLIDQAVAEIKTALRLSRRITGQDDFEVYSQQEALKALEQTDQVFVIFLGSIAGVSLLVGGIGIMNIMLVSVTERTREIGIRQAMGAKRRDILAQFVTEAVFLTLGGGLLGVMLGFGASTLINGLGLGDGFTLRTIVSADIVFISLIVSVLIGLFFGIYPAVRAAKLHPIEALKYE